MEPQFNGLGMNLGNLARLSKAITRSISAENPTGAKGQGGKATTGPGENAARELGQGWKVSPCISVGGNATVTLADIDGPGAILHFWMTATPSVWRRLILRIFWTAKPPHPSKPRWEIFSVMVGGTL